MEEFAVFGFVISFITTLFRFVMTGKSSLRLRIINSVSPKIIQEGEGLVRVQYFGLALIVNWVLSQFISSLELTERLVLIIDAVLLIAVISSLLWLIPLIRKLSGD